MKIGEVMIGDLVADQDGQMGIVLTEPELCADCEPGGEAYEEGDIYWLVDVQLPGYIERMATDEIEILSCARR